MVLPDSSSRLFSSLLIKHKLPHVAKKHRGFAFLTFANPADAQDAIDNYDLNELPGHKGRGKFLKCSIANPNKFGGDGSGNGRGDRAGMFLTPYSKYCSASSEEW